MNSREMPARHSNAEGWTAASDLNLDELARLYVMQRVARRELSPATGDANLRRLRSVFANAQVIGVDELVKLPALWSSFAFDWSPSTENATNVVVRRFGVWLVAQGASETNPITILPKSHRIVSTRGFECVDVAAVLRCAATRAGLAVGLMGIGGLRLVEVQRLRWQDVDLDRRQMLISGKGGHERIVDIDDDLADLLAAARTPHVRPHWAVVSSARIWGRSLSVVTISQEVKGALRTAGSSASPHMLRKTASTNRVYKGQTLDQVREFLGHVEIDTTASYLPPTIFGLRAASSGRTYKEEETSWPPIPEEVRTREVARPVGRKRAMTFKSLPPNVRADLSPAPRGLGDLLDDYLGRNAARWQPTTVDRTSRLLNDFVASAVTIDHASINAWLSKPGLARSTIRARVSILRGWTRALMAEGHLRSDPMLAIRPPHFERKVPRILTADQCRRLLLSIHRPTVKMMCLFALQEALAPAAIAAINVEDLDLQELTLATPKGIVPVSMETAIEVRRHLRSVAWTTGPLVRHRDTDARLDSKLVAMAIGKACRRAEVPGNATILRMTAAANIAATMPRLNTLRQALGHAQLSTTLRYVRESARECSLDGYAPRAWAKQHDVQPSQFVTMQEATEALGISMRWLRALLVRLGITPIAETGPPLLAIHDIELLREHRIQHPRGDACQPATDVAAEIVRLHDVDDRTFVWIARRLSRDNIPAGRRTCWTVNYVRRTYRDHKSQ